jgi:hypothetical protein
MGGRRARAATGVDDGAATHTPRTAVRHSPLARMHAMTADQSLNLPHIQPQVCDPAAAGPGLDVPRPRRWRLARARGQRHAPQRGGSHRSRPNQRRRPYCCCCRSTPGGGRRAGCARQRPRPRAAILTAAARRAAAGARCGEAGSGGSAAAAVGVIVAAAPAARGTAAGQRSAGRARRLCARGGRAVRVPAGIPP